MRFLDKADFFYRQRPTVRFWAIAGLFFCLLQSLLLGQRLLDERAQPGMECIDQKEGAQRLASFRQQRLNGDYVFEFQLEHKPRRARTTRKAGVMWGTWNAQGALTRIRIFTDSDAEDAPRSNAIDWIVQSGPAPQAWIREHEQMEFRPVKGKALFEPLLEGLNYSVFDLQMPFIHWNEFEYEGPELVGATRVAQSFLMFAPEESPSRAHGIAAVRIGLDDTYNALLRIEVLGDDGEEHSRFQVESFKKVGGEYIVKKITLTDYPSKDRTTFNVTDASVGLELDPDLFAVSLQ